MTEDEAKKKWCPLARYDENANRDATNDADYSPCIASACMAWRISSPAVAATIQKTELAAGSTPMGDGWKIIQTGTDEPAEGGASYSWSIWSRETAPANAATGYCGAFGKP